MPQPNPARAQFEKQLATLVQKFDQRRDEFMRADYVESQVRLDFIDPFLEALGWDVRNTQNLSDREREVSVESGQTSGRPDYNIRWKGQTQFFLEAKAPHVPLDSSRVILQAKKYAYNETSQMVMLAATSDFEEFRLYEVRDISYLRRINKGLIFEYRYDDYLTPKALDDLWKLSHESVAAGSLDVLVTPAARRERQRIPLDQQFLADLVGWREKLAKAVFKAHPDLSADDLNSIVQVFLDRLIFIRVAEDRGVLPENQLRDIARHWVETGKSKSILAELLPLFRAVNQKLNGEIFKPHRCEEIQLDSALVAEIIDDGLEPYNFAQIGVELLGSIYERYLGKTIRVTETRAVVEDKPAVRKAGGVYYTPKYIVDYIVAQTVGKLIEGKTPKQIEKLRVLDPACGSGSFLLGAYQTLLDYHTRYKAGDAKPETGSQARLLDAHEGGEFRLSLEQKAQILRNNIYGVDIDPQAVEITMMSLYIKMLEGERGAITGQGVLPRLRENIKCGNSLIGYDIGDLSAEDKARINPFDWNSKSEGFGEIVEQGGFDAVIGNPPYIRSQSLEAADREYYIRNYQAATRTYDIYVLFVERALSYSNRAARCGFILPNKFFTTDYGEGLRKMLTGKNQIERLVDFEDAQVFPEAGTYTTLLFISKDHSALPEYAHLGAVYREFGTAGLEAALSSSDIAYSPIILTKDGSRWTLAAGEKGELLLRLQETYKEFMELDPHVFQGLKTSADKVYLVRIQKRIGALSEVENGLGELATIETKMLKTVAKGEHVQRYYTDLSANMAIIYPYRVDANGKATLMVQNELSKEFPRTWDYLNIHKKTLGARDKGLWDKRSDWYAYARSQNIGAFLGQKFLVPYMTTQLRVAPDEGNIFLVNITTGGYGVRLHHEYHHNHYFLALLNSALMNYCIQQMTNRFRGGYFAVNKQALDRLPIRTINFSDPADKARHDKMVTLVERMLDLHKQKQAATSDAARERLEREIHVTDEQIDALVYELYGLTKEEIKIVEGN